MNGPALPAQGANESGAPPGRRSVHMIVAHSKNRIIGREGDMPWRLRDDLRFFKETTTGHTVVMGRKTFQSIGRPLPNRTNIVITRDPNFAAPGVIVAASPEEALALAQQAGAGNPDNAVFVIGGGQIYKALLPVTDVVYVTVVDAELEGDTTFPELSDDWQWSELRSHQADEHNDYDFTVYKVQREV